jgi:CO/xanthine dehydrogenase Mo-binding subunit
MIGRSIPSRDALAKVTGSAKYAGDVYLKDMLHLKVLFAGKQHARILSIDINQAEQAPGVVAILTAKDVPSNRYGLIIPDQPVLCDHKVRFEGDQVATVIAETASQAAQAAQLIKVVYEDLPVVSNPPQGLMPSSPQLHSERPNNIAHTVRIQKGDPDSAFQKSFLVYENQYQTPIQEHVFLEPEAGFAYLDDQDKIVVHASGQCVHDDQKQIAAALNLDPEQIRVVYGAIGGAFGGREDISVQILLALAAKILKRPVRVVWSRKESIHGHHKRHATSIKHKWCVNKQGEILGAEVEVTLDAGAYLSTSESVLEGFLSHCFGPYQVPHVNLNGKAIYTNNVPGGAFRGFGSPQAAFAAELHLTQIAELLGIDPIAIRLRNYLSKGSQLPTQTVLSSEPNLSQLTEICAKKLGWQEKNGEWQSPTSNYSGTKITGFGIASGMKNSGFGFGYPERSEAKVMLYGESSVDYAEIYTAAVDVGQGSHTVLAQIAAHVLDLPLEQVKMITSDTYAGGDAGAASASRLTLMAGNAVKRAADLALKDWQDENRPAIGKTIWRAPKTTHPDPITGECQDNISYSFGVQGVEVEVDLETGQVLVKKVVAVHDPGRAINPTLIEGQIEGAIIQALGWTILEDFVIRDAVIESDSLRTYLIPTAVDIPQEMEIILLENPDPIGPYGVKGIGEIPFVPLAPAIVSAIHDAIGIWFNKIPINGEVLLSGLRS